MFGHFRERDVKSKAGPPQKSPLRKKNRKGDLRLEPWTFQPIGVVESCFKEKFGIPRQGSLATTATGALQFIREDDFKAALKGLETFSHAWVFFVFHEHGGIRWRPSIRPPRLGGAKKVGVLASRSPHRPNPIGLSVVKIERILLDDPRGPRVEVSGLDILDGSPLLDIKPYIPYADSIPEASGGWAAEEIPKFPVVFSELAEKHLVERALLSFPNLPPDAARSKLRALIVELLEIDPRPAAQRRKLVVGTPETEGTRYGFYVLDWDVKWKIADQSFLVTDIVDRS